MKSRPTIALLAFVAWRGLVQSPLIAALMCLAVAAGVAFQIPNNANLRGYEEEILQQGVTAGFGAVRVRPQQGRQLHDVPVLLARMQALPGVTAAIPILTLAGAVGSDEGFEDAFVIGVDAGGPRRPYTLMRGTHLSAGDAHGILIGSALATRMKVDVGSEVQVRVILMMRTDLVGDDAMGRYTMTIRGVVAGNFVAPSAIIMDRQFLIAELGTPEAASVLAVHTADPWIAPELAELIGRDPELQAMPWGKDSPFLDAAVKSSETIGAVSYAMVMLAVIIPVWALLYISVLHRQRQVVLLCAVGFTRGAVFAIYLAQAFVIGVIGAAVGALVALGLLHYFDAHPLFEMDDFVIVPVRTLRTYLEPALIVLAATVLAGVWPAHRASRLEPSRILRSGR